MLNRVVDTNGIRMHIAEAGAGPLVLLCHGFPETSYSWRHQLTALADAGYHAVAPDMRGYGKTDCPTMVEAYTVLDSVADLVCLLDTLGERQAVIVGNDWGSTIAWQAALLRPDRFRAVAAIGVPLMGRAPLPPTRLFPQTEAELLYVLYFQVPGVADRELNRDVRATLRKILFAASGEAGARRPGDGTPNPFGMVSKADGLLASLPNPVALPSWLTAADLDVFAEAFVASGFSGGLNYYRKLDRNWRIDAAFAGLKVEVPALYLVGERDAGFAIPGMRDIIATMPNLAPRLEDSIVLAGCGHWVPQERPDEVNAALVAFLARHPA